MKPIDEASVKEIEARILEEGKRYERLMSEQVGPLRDSIRDLKKSLGEALSTFEVGDPVIWTNGRKEEKAIISGVQYNYERHVTYFVRVLKKDGTPGIRNQQVWGGFYVDGSHNYLRLDESRVVSAVGKAGTQ